MEVIKGGDQGEYKMGCKNCGCIYQYEHPKETYKRFTTGSTWVNCPSCGYQEYHSKATKLHPNPDSKPTKPKLMEVSTYTTGMLWWKKTHTIGVDEGGNRYLDGKLYWDELDY